MSINIGPASSDELRPKIMVIGVGGAGGNAIANMMQAQIEGVEFIVANTDAQALSTSPSEKRIQLGPDITGGLGAGARPEVGKAAAEETVEELEDALEGVNMVFIAAGMGGGTGTGAAPVIAEAARRKGVLTVGVVTKPFLFEGTRRMRAADAGIEELQKHVDTLIVIPNQNLFLVAKAETTFKEAFMLADEVLQQGVRSITDLMVMPGLINLDFADVRSVMSEMGKAMMGTGEGEGENRALEAAERAIANPLLDGVSMAGARGVIISIIGGEDMKLLEVDEAANHIRELVDEDANIIWGSAFNPELEGKIRVSVVATGIDGEGAPLAVTPRAFTMSEQRAPQRPVLDLPSEDIAEEEPFELSEGLSAEPEFEPETGMAVEEEGPLDLAETADADNSVLSEDLGYDMGEDEDDEDYDDVDGIVDPLAGLRNEETERFEGGWGPDEGDGGGSTLDLSTAMEQGGQDELELGADQYADGNSPLASKPMRKRPLLSSDYDDDESYGGGSGGGSGVGSDSGSTDSGSTGGGASAQGSTLFERMANLSRGANKPDEDEDDDDGDGGGSLNIPRFLNRQNNQ
jgi:cell division protein FtsZ